jgi:Uma2 family endonuclease
MSKVEEPQAQYQAQPKREKITLEAYLEMIADGTRRLEYHDGEVLDIQSATESHGLICTNITTFIGHCLIEKDCYMYAGDRELWIQDCRRMFYPDHIVVCGKHDLKQMSKNVKATINPSVVIEVLSDSTKDHDQTTKLKCYKKIKSLRQIIFVSQTEKYVRTLIKFKNEDAWKDKEYVDDEDKIPVGACEIVLKNIYLRVNFENINPQPISN